MSIIIHFWRLKGRVKIYLVVFAGIIGAINAFGQNSAQNYAGFYDCKLIDCYPETHPPAGPTVYCYTSYTTLTIDTVSKDSIFTIHLKDKDLTCNLKPDSNFYCGFSTGKFFNPDSVMLFIPLLSAFGGGESYLGHKSNPNHAQELSVYDVNIFPNPFTNEFKIYTITNTCVGYSMNDLYGRIVFTYILNSNSRRQDTIYFNE